MSAKFIRNLVASEALNIRDYLINNYKTLGLNETETLLMIHLYQLKQQGNDFLSVKLLTERMSLNFVQCSDMVLNLVQRNYIAFDIDFNSNGVAKEKFTLEPLYDKIYQQLNAQSKEVQSELAMNNVAELIQMIETEFGRTLSSFEIQLISSWISEYHFSIEIIKLAFKEALLANAYNLKYVDRILINWKSKNIESVEDAMGYTKTFKRFEVKRGKQEVVEEEEYVSWMK